MKKSCRGVRRRGATAQRHLVFDGVIHDTSLADGVRWWWAVGCGTCLIIGLENTVCYIEIPLPTIFRSFFAVAAIAEN